MAREPPKVPVAKPVPLDDPLAKLIDILSDEIDPIVAPDPNQEKLDEADEYEPKLALNCPDSPRRAASR